MENNLELLEKARTLAKKMVILECDLGKNHNSIEYWMIHGITISKRKAVNWYLDCITEFELAIAVNPTDAYAYHELIILYKQVIKEIEKL